MTRIEQYTEINQEKRANVISHSAGILTVSSLDFLKSRKFNKEMFS